MRVDDPYGVQAAVDDPIGSVGKTGGDPPVAQGVSETYPGRNA